MEARNVAEYKRPQYVDVDNVVRRPKKGERTAESSQVGQPVVRYVYGPGPSGSIAGRPYKAAQAGVKGGDPVASSDRRLSHLRETR